MHWFTGSWPHAGFRVSSLHIHFLALVPHDCFRAPSPCLGFRLLASCWVQGFQPQLYTGLRVPGPGGVFKVYISHLTLKTNSSGVSFWAPSPCTQMQAFLPLDCTHCSRPFINALSKPPGLCISQETLAPEQLQRILSIVLEGSWPFSQLFGGAVALLASM